MTINQRSLGVPPCSENFYIVIQYIIYFNLSIDFTLTQRELCSSGLQLYDQIKPITLYNRFSCPERPIFAFRFGKSKGLAATVLSKQDTDSL